MRKVVAYELLSLDGVAESPMDYITDWDDAMQLNLGRVIADQDAVLLGRRTYDDWSVFWPKSDIEPFASFINSVQKYVVTATPPDLAWGNTAVAEGDLADFVNDLRSRPGRDIGVHGSICLAQTLLNARLIDELRLVVAPTLRMHGRRLFDQVAQTRLTLTRSVTSPMGYLLLDYKVGN